MNVGRALAGRYELLAVIGRGGMGTVYRATDAVLGRTVAVKVLPPAFAEADPVNVARFEREARAAASLANPGIVTVYDTGIDEGTRFIVMEYVAGRSVATILREERRLQPAPALEIAMGIADALGAAHGAGIIHRDIKPANLMVVDDRSVKVLDFGLARALDGTVLTHSATVLGTAAYMAPEQVLGRPADERSDIYSLGCVLYAMIAGRPPFAGETVAAILHQQVNAEPQSLHGAERDVPFALDAVVMEMLAKSPDARPQSTRQLRDRLAQTCPEVLARPSGNTAPMVRRRATARVPRPAAAALATREPPRRLVANRGRLAVIAALVCLALAVLAGALLGSGSAPSTLTSGHHSTAKQPSRARPHGTVAAPAADTPAPDTSTSTAASEPAATTPSAPATPTVAASAGALTTLLTGDVEAGSIEQHAAQQIANELANILNSFEMGHTMNLPHELANLTQQVEMLEGHGQVSPAAAAPLHAALANLDTALAKSDPETEEHSQQGPPDALLPPPVPANGHRARHPGHDHHK